MSISKWLDHSQQQKMTADIVIIGGGVAGSSVAYWLAEEDPGLKVVLLEKGEIASGATGRNAGFITCGSVEHFNRLYFHLGKEKAHEIWRFSEINLELLKTHIIDGHESKLDFEHKGSFSLASTSEEFDELKKSHQIMSQLNISVEVLQESDIQKRLGAEKFVGGIKYCDDASVNPVALTQEIFEATKKKSAHFEVFENSEVFSIEEQGGDKRILSAKAEVSAPIVIYATNAYSSLLQNYFSDKIFPTRGQILVTEPVPYFMEGPCYANFVLDYFRQLPSGEMLIGGFRQLQKDAELGYADIISDVIQEALEKFLETHIPAVRGKKITHRWSGIMGFSSDGQPMVGSLPNDNQSFFTGGFTAHGLGLAFHAGKTLVDLMFEREIPEFISAKRFN